MWITLLFVAVAFLLDWLAKPREKVTNAVRRGPKPVDNYQE
jgi:hypothetical protein